MPVTFLKIEKRKMKKLILDCMNTETTQLYEKKKVPVAFKLFKRNETINDDK